MGGDDNPARFSVARAGLALAVIAVALAGLMGRVLWLQTTGRAQTLARADRQQHQRTVLFARRGDIFDRNGILMAGTVQTRAVYADPFFFHEAMTQPRPGVPGVDEAIARLAPLVGRDPGELRRLLSDHAQLRFVKLLENVDDATAVAITRLGLPGIGLTPCDQRYYPMGSLAAHLLGGSSRDGHGLDGLELKFNALLAGHDGYVRSVRDAQHRPLTVAVDDYVPPRHGQHLVLTIDANIQFFAEQELAETCQKFHAKRGEVVVMDPRNGEVLALANYPTFNPQINDAPPELRRDSALVSPYEPGSTIKPFVLGPALAAGTTSLTEVWPIHGGRYRTPYGRTISDVHAFGPLASWDVLVKSSNIGMSMLAERMGNAALHRDLARWGFGRPTGIDLPGENAGRLNPLHRWNKYSTESVAQGYEIMVTPLQLCRAFCAYANGGRLISPALIRGVVSGDGAVVPRHLPAGRSAGADPVVIDPRTALQLRRVMCDVPIRGTAAPVGGNEGGRSDIWTIFGKTGTAHISQGSAGYSTTRFNSSFLCGAPAEDPRLVVAFIVHEPDRSLGHYGGTVSAPGARRLIERSLAYLQVPPSPPLPPPPSAIQSILDHFDVRAYERKSKISTADASE